MMRNGLSLSGRERNCVFLNRGNGKFATVSALSGYDMPDDARGLATMDWDFDGRLDFWSSARTAPQIRFMRNQLENTGDWLGFRLRGTGKSNRDAIGARVSVQLESGRTVIRSLRAGEGFASQSSKWLHMGLGTNAKVKSVHVRWPTGETEQFADTGKNAYFKLTQGAGKPERYQAPALKSLSPGYAGLKKGECTGMARVPLRVTIPAPPVRYRSNGENKVTDSKPARPLLINLWRQGCEVCRHELEEFTEAGKELEGKVDILALCVDPEPAGQAKAGKFTSQLQFPWQSGFPTKGSVNRLVLIFSRSFPLVQDLPTPSSLLISVEGEIVAIYTRPITSKELLRDAAALASRKLSPVDRDQAVSAVQGRWLKRPTDINLLYLPQLMMKEGLVDDAASYVRKAHAKLGRHKDYAKLLVWIAEQQLARGQQREALIFYNNALIAGKSNPFVLNNIAWLHATHPDPSIRNGKLALEVAGRAVELTSGKNPSYKDTLAAAYAENGDFNKAIAIATSALKMVDIKKNPALHTSLRQSLLLYRAQKPMRQ